MPVTLASAVQPALNIVQKSQHSLTIFKAKAIADLSAAIYDKKGKPCLKCYATGKERLAKPEELVRQLYVKMLMDDYGCSRP